MPFNILDPYQDYTSCCHSPDYTYRKKEMGHNLWVMKPICNVCLKEAVLVKSTFKDLVTRDVPANMKAISKPLGVKDEPKKEIDVPLIPDDFE